LATITVVLWLTAIISVLVSYTDVFHNSMMPYAARRSDRPGLGPGAVAWKPLRAGDDYRHALGFSLPGIVHSSLLPSKPLFGLDRATGDNIRIVGPLVGWECSWASCRWFSIPKTPSRTAQARSGDARRRLGNLDHAAAHARAVGSGLFLISRMLYADARLAALMFGGIYAAGVMKWGSAELLAMGLFARSSACLADFLRMARHPDRTRRALVLRSPRHVCLFAQLTISPTMIFLVRSPPLNTRRSGRRRSSTRFRNWCTF